MKNKIYVIIEGGVIQDILADNPDELEINFIDYDVEGIDEEVLTVVEGDEAFVNRNVNINFRGDFEV